jgi:hypothetical protein
MFNAMAVEVVFMQVDSIFTEAARFKTSYQMSLADSFAIAAAFCRGQPWLPPATMSLTRLCKMGLLIFSGLGSPFVHQIITHPHADRRVGSKGTEQHGVPQRYKQSLKFYTGVYAYTLV